MNPPAAASKYVEDCQVCCKPNVLDVRWSAADEAFVIHAELESCRSPLQGSLRARFVRPRWSPRPRLL